MKHFFKSLFTTLLIGIPVVIVLMVALVFFQKDDENRNPPVQEPEMNEERDEQLPSEDAQLPAENEDAEDE